MDSDPREAALYFFYLIRMIINIYIALYNRVYTRGVCIAVNECARVCVCFGCLCAPPMSAMCVCVQCAMTMGAYIYDDGRASMTMMADIFSAHSAALIQSVLITRWKPVARCNSSSSMARIFMDICCTIYIALYNILFRYMQNWTKRIPAYGCLLFCWNTQSVSVRVFEP